VEKLMESKNQELEVVKVFAICMSKQHSSKESKVKNLKAQMEDRETICAKAKLDLQMATNDLIAHKAYLVRSKEKLDGGVVETWASSTNDLAKLQTIIGDVEYRQKNMVALEQKARLGKSLYQITCKDY
jgi:hypothetical protein